MKRDEHRSSTEPPLQSRIPSSPPGPCMRGVLDLELYNRTGEVRMIEPLEEYEPPVVTDIEALVRGGWLS